MPNNDPENVINPQIQLEDFLTRLVKAVAESQTGLEQYYRDTAEGRRSSVAYTIPSASMEVKLNFSTVTEKGISFIFKKTSETQTEVFSSLKLNLTALPNPALSKETPTRYTQNIVHTVAPGETLAQIARKYDVTIAEIQAWNPTAISDPDRIDAGLALSIFLP
jgi:LysM repeat protein